MRLSLGSAFVCVLFAGVMMTLVGRRWIEGPPLERRIWNNDLQQLSRLDKTIALHRIHDGRRPRGGGGDRAREHLRVRMTEDVLAQFESWLAEHDLDLDDLDQRESFVLWAGGVYSKEEQDYLSFPKPGRWNVMLSDLRYPFKKDRLTDVDGDGWMEYSHRDGLHFVLTEGGVVGIEYEDTGGILTMEFILAGGNVWSR